MVSVAGRGGAIARILFAIALPVHRGRDSRLDAERTAYPRHAAVLLGPIDQHLFPGRLIVRNGLKRYMRHNPAYFLSLPVLSAPVLKATCGSSIRVIEPMKIEGSCKHSLASQRDGHPGGIARDPAPPPFLGAPSGCSRSTCRIEHQVARVGGHQQTALDHFRVGLDDIEFFFSKAACKRVRPDIASFLVWKIGSEATILNAIGCNMDSICFSQAL